jgi:hypothetical protein
MEDYESDDDDHNDRRRRTESRLEKRRANNNNEDVVDSYEYYGKQGESESEEDQVHAYSQKKGKVIGEGVISGE